MKRLPKIRFRSSLAIAFRAGLMCFKCVFRELRRPNVQTGDSMTVSYTLDITVNVL